MRYSGNFTWSSVAETLEQQTRYGQGQIGANGGAEYTTSASGSWGPVLDGSQKRLGTVRHTLTPSMAINWRITLIPVSLKIITYL